MPRGACQVMRLARDFYPLRTPSEYVDVRRVVECACIYALAALHAFRANA